MVMRRFLDSDTFCGAVNHALCNVHLIGGYDEYSNSHCRRNSYCRIWQYC